jgi:hypothetical protein
MYFEYWQTFQGERELWDNSGLNGFLRFITGFTDFTIFIMKSLRYGSINIQYSIFRPSGPGLISAWGCAL